MPDSTTPTSQMIRVPTPLMAAVKEISRLHRLGRTHAVLSGLQQVIANIDSEADIDIVGDSSPDSKVDLEVIAGMIAKAIAAAQTQLEERVEQRIHDVIKSEVGTMLGECSA